MTEREYIDLSNTVKLRVALTIIGGIVKENIDQSVDVELFGNAIRDLWKVLDQMTEKVDVR
jgi:hypothetical protein